MFLEKAQGEFGGLVRGLLLQLHSLDLLFSGAMGGFACVLEQSLKGIQQGRAHVDFDCRLQCVGGGVAGLAVSLSLHPKQQCSCMQHPPAVATLLLSML